MFPPELQTRTGLGQHVDNLGCGEGIRLSDKGFWQQLLSRLKQTATWHSVGKNRTGQSRLVI